MEEDEARAGCPADTLLSPPPPPDPLPPPTVTATDRLDRAVISPSVSPALPDCRSLQLYCLLSLISPLLKVSYPCPCRKLLPGVLMTLESNREDFKSRV